MRNSDHTWTGRFTANALKEHDRVLSVESLGTQRLRVVRREMPSVIVGTLGATRVTELDVEDLLRSDADIEFVVNVPRDSVWTGSAIDVLVGHGAGWGSVGDLFRAISHVVVRGYLNPELAFVERGLRQHTRVVSVTRAYDRKYVVYRDNSMPPVVVVQLNEYDITADHVRTAHDAYGPFDYLLHANPNGDFTDDAHVAAQAIGCELGNWGDLLRRLHR